MTPIAVRHVTQFDAPDQQAAVVATPTCCCCCCCCLVTLVTEMAASAVHLHGTAVRTGRPPQVRAGVIAGAILAYPASGVVGGLRGAGLAHVAPPLTAIGFFLPIACLAVLYRWAGMPANRAVIPALVIWAVTAGAFALELAGAGFLVIGNLSNNSGSGQFWFLLYLLAAAGSATGAGLLVRRRMRQRDAAWYQPPPPGWTPPPPGWTPPGGWQP